MARAVDITESARRGVGRAYSGHFQLFHKTKAFTLVEVLITIGIIGVVAAITIVVLIQNTNNQKFVTRFKKTLSTLAQASLTAIAQYDMDYSSLSQDSDDSTCATDSLAKGNSTMCGMFNSVLSVHSYQGVYGTVKGANIFSPYHVDTTTEGFDLSNNLIYSLADGTIVGFKPGAKNCTLKAGNVLSKEMLLSGGGLENCIGFIDVNGVHGPNKEVTCANGTSEFSTSSCLIKSSGNAISDVFPIVFHDGTVEPATNAARAVLARGQSSTDSTQDEDVVVIGRNPYTGVDITVPRYKTANGNKYEYDTVIGKYTRIDSNGEKFYLSNSGNEYDKSLGYVPSGTDKYGRLLFKDGIYTITIDASKINIGSDGKTYYGNPGYAYSIDDNGKIDLTTKYGKNGEILNLIANGEGGLYTIYYSDVSGQIISSADGTNYKYNDYVYTINGNASFAQTYITVKDREGNYYLDYCYNGTCTKYPNGNHNSSGDNSCSVEYYIGQNRFTKTCAGEVVDSWQL